MNKKYKLKQNRTNYGLFDKELVMTCSYYYLCYCSTVPLTCCLYIFLGSYELNYSDMLLSLQVYQMSNEKLLMLR